MRALVTGASGFVGRHLTAALRESGWRVTTLDRTAPADLVGDLRSLSLRSVRADVVFHLAGFANPAASQGAEREAYQANVVATARLVREARAGRFVIASSCQVYRPSMRPQVEEGAVRPGNPYSATKLCSEAVALASGRDVVVLRPFNHTGPGQTAAYVCPNFARQIARAEAGLGPRAVAAAGDLAAERDFFDVRDMARAYLLAASRGRSGGVYNVATGRPVSIGGILRTLVSLARVPLRIQGRAGRRTVLTGDPSRFREATGWRPEIPLRRTLSDLLDYERASLTP